MSKVVLITKKKKKPQKSGYKKITIELPESEFKTYIADFERKNEFHKTHHNKPLLKGKYFGKAFLEGEDAKEELEALKEAEPEVVKEQVEKIIYKNSPKLIAFSCFAIFALIMLIIAFFRKIRQN